MQASPLSPAAARQIPPVTNAIDTGRPFVYLTGASEQQRRPVIMCLVEKGGSSMWTLALLRGLGINGTFGRQLNGSFGRTGHGVALPYSVTQKQWTSWLRDPMVPRYMIVRHPHARLLSGYLGKVLRKPSPHFWPAGYNVSTGFAGFVRAVIHARSLDSHYSLMTDHCAIPNGLTYSFLRAEELNDWYRGLVCALSLTSVVATGWTQFKSTHGPGERGTKQNCFVKTPDCRCKVDCNGPRCNGAPPKPKRSVAPSESAAHGTFNNATALLNKYFDRELAGLVNHWARRDLELFGYHPWVPGRALIGPAGAKPRRGGSAEGSSAAPRSPAGAKPRRGSGPDIPVSAPRVADAAVTHGSSSARNFLPAGAPCSPLRTGDSNTASCGKWCNERKCEWCKCRSCRQCSGPFGALTEAPCHLAYVIFSMQRSGTTTICRDLNHFNMNCMFELFNWGKNNAGLRWSGRLNISDVHARDFPLGFIGSVLRWQNATGTMNNANHGPILQVADGAGPTGSQCKAGFKLFPGHVIPAHVGATLASTCIIYRRENVTALYLSSKRALNQGCWGTQPDEQRQCESRAAPVIGDDFEAYKRNYSLWFRQAEDACTAAGRRIVRLTTEEYLRARGVLQLTGLLDRDRRTTTLGWYR